MSLVNIRLADLNPKLSDTQVLTFDCPTCGDHKIRVPIGQAIPNRDGEAWKSTGEFPNTLTLTPSINAGCWHGHITNGEITP